MKDERLRKLSKVGVGERGKERFKFNGNSLGECKQKDFEYGGGDRHSCVYFIQLVAVARFSSSSSFSVSISKKQL